ncbi:CDP-diacylglycerol---serine O-phosphatidyltransferase [Flavobacterium glycines]|uniref:CDP-diacylglycerol---serine O-phosphatidyltransferase n=2 Tax=Flavobacterium glycines TaxID=551990 RepID=A0A1B9DH82_9FLAO|nr:CDP-alcohol phosphatidyltransferase family protein [Flavobacterium glycines]OCB69035.1 phosphatidylserine synthase [Flavobacterium glycines]SDJ52112.1 CDP-diacylglycerol---serine O-phosphatidyltransferase [Flavobacterium glycines]
MNIKKHIPNCITLLNLFCGCIAMVFVSKQEFEIAFFFVFLGIFFDFFDGFFARLFKVTGALGLQLDSLADMVTSGVVPGYVMYYLLVNSQHEITACPYFPFLGFVITMGSCYRLAFFNIDTRQTDSFIGLPTPANSLFMLSLPLVIKYSDSLVAFELLTSQWVLLLITAFSAFILNAEIPLFSLKIKKFTLKDNLLQIIFITLSVLLVLFFHYAGVPLVIISYVLLSVLNNRFSLDGKAKI